MLAIVTKSRESQEKVKSGLHSRWKEKYGRKGEDDSKRNNKNGNEKVIYGKTSTNGKGGYRGPLKPLMMS
jgi:hypothetical protein